MSCNRSQNNTCRRLNLWAPSLPQIEPWSVIGSCGPGLDDPRQYQYRASLANIYPTMDNQYLSRLSRALEPQDKLIQEQRDLINEYRQMVHQVQDGYEKARRAGQTLFDNPLNEYVEPLMDPTRGPDQQPVTLGMKPNQLVFMGNYTINECGGLEPILANSGQYDFI